MNVSNPGNMKTHTLTNTHTHCKAKESEKITRYLKITRFLVVTALLSFNFQLVKIISHCMLETFAIYKAAIRQL